eukprot:CAMPEP_0168561664 /NCGR_PEP_ID=MMETSP0413-20121227/11715_1 /TAXON_ID=136452 /ORGANISM="Filamoeba nolandi, Strain NC-AS-23-1" /LENGTH=619 /DNA_ID=CAMNT_0008593049 /DNA_START=598 /DNA_END=2457 /DNA_ORIENTATION=-
MADDNKSNNIRSTCVGIDLGTTYSCVGVWENDAVTIIPNQMGNRTTPSWVAYTEHERLVGEAAKNQAIRNPQNTIYDSKRMIGRKFGDETIQSDIKLWPFKVVPGEHNNAAIQVNYKGEVLTLPPEHIQAVVLKYMKQIAEDYLGHPVTRAVITVPAYFNDAQRQATKDAGSIAGLQVERIINEPTAAALAYGLDKLSSDKPLNLLIFDLGGGTFDVTTLVVDGGIFEVKSTSGDTHLGGEDFDNRLLSYFIQEFKEKNGKDLTENPKAIKKLKQKCTEAKHILSQSLKATVEIDSLFDGIDFESTITRAKFDELNEDLFLRCLEPVKKALADAQLDKKQIDEIVLIGGSTRIVAIQKILEQFFEGKQLCKRINPDEAVAYGAAIQAANLSLTPEQKSQTRLQGITLMDVTPLSLGIELVGGKMSVIIPRNTTIPYSHTKTYFNHEDNQTEAEIQVFEGEDALTCNNRLLGTFILKGFPPRPRGQVSVDVTFSINANGILEVTAQVRDSPTTKTTMPIIQNKGLLNQDQIQVLANKELNVDKEAAANQQRIKAINDLEKLANKLKKQAASTGAEQQLKVIEETLKWSSSNTNNTSLQPAEIQQKQKQLQDLFAQMSIFQ